MKNFLDKILNKKVFIITYVLVTTLLLVMPWMSPVELTTSGREGEMVITTRGIDGTTSILSFDLSKTEFPIRLFNQEVISVSPKSLQAKITPSSPIKKNEIIISIFISSLMLVFLLYYIFHLTRRILHIENPMSGFFVFLAHFFILGAILFCNLPGFFDFDGFANLELAANTNWSEFLGLLTSSFLMILFRLLPHAWALSALNVLLISFFLCHLYVISAELRVRWVYFISCLIFYIYPINLVVSLASTRDTIANWIMLIFLIETFKFFAEEKFQKRSLLHLSLTACLISMIRLETFYLLTIFLIYMAFTFSGKQRLWTIATIFLILGVHQISSLRFNLREIGKLPYYHYQTTVLINPLSYILKNKYPKGLPQEIKEELGTYFKNDYLILHQKDLDIDPLHNGGINFEASEKDYLKFRAAALKIIISNPVLFLENRILLSKVMLGLNNETNNSTTSEYNEKRTYYDLTKKLLNLKEYPDSLVYRRLLDYIEDNTFWLSSYFFPILILLSCLFFTPFSWFHKVSIFLIARTLFVLITAPASYFKYNYILWLFPVFALPTLVWSVKSKGVNIPQWQVFQRIAKNLLVK